MAGKWRTFSEELAELERTDPAVKAVAESYDRMVDHLLRGVPVTQFRKSTLDSPCEAVREAEEKGEQR